MREKKRVTREKKARRGRNKRRYEREKEKKRIFFAGRSDSVDRIGVRDNGCFRFLSGKELFIACSVAYRRNVLDFYRKGQSDRAGAYHSVQHFIRNHIVYVRLLRGNDHISCDDRADGGAGTR